MTSLTSRTAPIPRDLTEELSHRIRNVITSEIGLVADRGRDDPDVVKLWIGEGDLPTPHYIVEAAEAALRAGHTRYTYSLGLPRLRQALSDYHFRHWNVRLPVERFTVTVGGMNALMQSAQAVLDPGDEIIVPTPAWPNLIESMRLAGGKPVLVPYAIQSDGRLALSIDDVLAAITPKTKAILINSPSNPTGWVMPREDMEKFVELSRTENIWIIADEVYAQFKYDGSVAPSFLQITDENDKVIVTNTFSKNWAMTGWRIGWAVLPPGLDKYYAKLSEYNTTGVPTFVQHAAIAALDQGDEFIGEMVSRCAETRKIFVDGLSQIEGVTVLPPDGAFYLMVGFPGNETSLDMAIRMLKEAKVGVAPGTAFGSGGQGYLRLCFAISPNLAREAVKRLTEFFKK